MSKITKKIKYAVQIKFIINFIRELKIKLYVHPSKKIPKTHTYITLIRFEHFKTLLTKNHPYYYNLVHNV